VLHYCRICSLFSWAFRPSEGKYRSQLIFIEFKFNEKPLVTARDFSYLPEQIDFCESALEATFGRYIYVSALETPEFVQHAMKKNKIDFIKFDGDMVALTRNISNLLGIEL